MPHANTNLPHALPNEWRKGLYETILRRRDMRTFIPGVIPDDVLARILTAANHAPSVGFSQPWNFILIRDMRFRRKLKEHVEQERILAAQHFEGERREDYLSFKLEGILESALNICVTSDRSRHGPAVIGRNSLREMDLYSTVTAVQNLWLAARAEGVGVGWVSILRNEVLSEMLELPDQVLPLAYLCVGQVAEFPESPLLEAAGWLPKLNLSDLVMEERWGGDTSASMEHALEQATNKML